MATLSMQILEHASSLEEGTPVSAKELLHLGNRAAVDQALARLAKRGKLIRLNRGTYVRPKEGRFGVRAPSATAVLEALSRRTGETITPNGAAAANKLGLTSQVPVRLVYLTNGKSRRLRLGAQEIELRHVPQWQVALPGRPAGEAIRALAWLGPEEAPRALRRLKNRLSPAETKALTSARAVLPSWLAEDVSHLVTHA